MATPVLTVLEEDRHAWFAGRTRAILKYLDLAFGEQPSQGEHATLRKVLDVGIGAGNMVHHLGHYGEVFGIDANPRPLAVAAQRGFDVSEASGTQLPFAHGQFDLVALLDTVEHIPDELGVFAECHRVLRRGGALLVTAPAMMWLWSYNDEINAHQRRYSVPELRQKLVLCGFDVKRISYNNFFLFPLIAGVRLLRPYNPGLASPHLSDDQQVYQVEMERIPEPVNTILHGIGWMEAELLQRFNLPFGTSVLCIAQKL
jgi:SAM-dependent methyltransferase